MSETALTPTNDTTPSTTPENLLLEGDAPRLGSAPLTAPAPMGGTGTPTVGDAPAAPTLPVVSPVLSDPNTPMQSGADLATPTLAAAPMLAAAPTLSTAPAPAAPAPAPVMPSVDDTPSIPAPSLPSLPTASPASTAPTSDEAAMADDDHPMAHLMGGANKVSEASQRAAELRAAKKAKAKKMKIGFAVGSLVVSAVVGPPLWSWFTNALNEAGDTSTEEPAD